MDSPEDAPDRVQIRGTGLGEVSDALIEERAAELAKMDGRHSPNNGDRIQAKSELMELPASPNPPEVDTATENLTAWDEPPSADGTAAERILPEDEANLAEQLVEEGLEEAEHEQRLAAADEDPPVES